MNLTSLAIHVELLRSAQVQQQLALKLIEASMEGVRQTTAKSDAVEGQKVEDVTPGDGGTSIDIRV